MAKVKSRNKNGSLIVDVRLPFGSELNERELSQLARKSVRGLLSAKKKWGGVIEYTGPMGISLSERLQQQIGKQDFIFIMAQVVSITQKLQAGGLILNKLMLDLRHVYFNETTKEVQFLYLPVEGNHVQVDVMAFLESIAYAVRPMSEKDMDYISRFVFFIKDMRGFDVKALIRFLEKEDREIVKRVRIDQIGGSGYITDKRAEYYDHYGSGAAGSGDSDDTAMLVEDDDDDTGLLVEEDDDNTGLLMEDDDNTGLLVEDDDDNTGLLAEEDDDNTGLLVEDDDDEGTGLLIEDDDGTYMLVEPDFTSTTVKPRYPTLTRLSTNEVITINKAVFLIGRGREFVDYYVSDNSAISRSHVNIITRSGRYFVEDLISKYGSFVNDCKIQAHWEMEIFDGDKLRLANEEFIFRR